MVSIIERKRLEVLGKEFDTNECGKCVVLDYKNAKEVTVEFYEPKCTVVCEVSKLKRGQVKNPMKPSYYNKGYIGVGKYGFKDFNPYRKWQSMLVRAYSDKYHKGKPTYKDVEVCEEWLNFQNFAEWYYDQKFSEAKDEKGLSYHLDKDLLGGDSRLYSPETCCFVPREINALITRTNRSGEKTTGVNFIKSSKKYQARLAYDGNDKHLGYFDTFEEAFMVYKKAKETHVKEVAEKWKYGVSKNVYKTLLKFEVESYKDEVYCG